MSDLTPERDLSLTDNERRLALLANPEGTEARKWLNLVLEAYDFVAAALDAECARNRTEEIGSLACDLLTALQPWEMHGAAVRSAAVRLTVALAAVPLPARLDAETTA